MMIPIMHGIASRLNVVSDRLPRAILYIMTIPSVAVVVLLDLT